MTRRTAEPAAVGIELRQVAEDWQAGDRAAVARPVVVQEADRDHPAAGFAHRRPGHRGTGPAGSE
jgi:hypothetical protein